MTFSGLFVRLVQIKLAGFKSFVEPTLIPTPGQLVGVVGPNGCGKSNIIDAVRWVMGESRASELRGESMQDVIFNGSTHRKPAARASVELVFDNSAGRASGQWATYSELSVKRILTRDGASSYFINNQLVRRRDVYDIFLGTGLGARGYAIIGQGMINRLIEARPDELRVYLEEAAGVSRYKERRRETESRLRDTRDNLTRVEDILRELTDQLARLESQAEVAGRYQTLQAQAQEKQQLLWLVREDHARQDQHDRFREMEQAQNQLESGLADLRKQEGALAGRRQSHYEAGDAVHAAQGRLFEVGAQVSRLEAEIRHIVQTRERAGQRQQQLTQQRDQWRQQHSHCDEQIGSLHTELDAAAAHNDELAARLDDAQAALSDLDAEVHQAAATRDALRQEVARIQQELALLAQSRRDAERRLQALGARQTRIDDELNHLPMPDTAELERLEQDEQVAARQLDAARGHLLELEARQPGLEQAHADAGAQARQANQAADGLQARLDALVALQNDVGDKSALQPWLARHALDGSQPLWQRITIRSGWETALEAVLRNHLGALPLDRLDDAARWAQQSPPARVAFYESPSAAAADAGFGTPAHETPAPGAPLHHESAPDAAIRNPALPPGATALMDWLEPQVPGLKAVLADWLQGVYACQTLDEALALRHHLAPGQRFVVPQGHVVDRHGVHFYAPDNDEAGQLARQAEIRRLEHDLKAQRLIAANEDAQLHKAQQALAGATVALGPARTRVAELTDWHHAIVLERSQLQQQAAGARDQRERLQHDRAELVMERDELAASLEMVQEQADGLEARLEEESARFEAAQNDGDALFQQAQARRDAVRALERQHQEADYAQRSTRARIQELQRNMELAAEQQARAEDELTSLQGELFDLDESTARAALEDALEQRVACEEALNEARIAHDDLTASLRLADEQRLTLERSLEPLRARITDLQLKEQAARLAVEQQREQLEGAGADRTALRKALDAVPADQRQPAALQAALARLTRQVDALGAVNLAALDELKAAREREQFLNAQYDDLTLAMETLEGAIRKIDSETRELLRTTFDAVNQHFGELFPRLFGGGEARLTMTGDEILDAGVQVMAQPPGKRNSTIQLLSGGEKALTAIALVFALFKLNPAPFCLLDEVDAPLDDANTGRYAQLVSAMSEHTQFLFISHNKIAMQMAKQLIGVTMQEQGVSRIVAVDMEAALEMAQA